MPRRMIILRLWMQEAFICRREFQVTVRGSTLAGETGGRLWFEFLELCEKIVAACNLATVFETDEIRLAGCA
jgi:hypothetical protein